MLTSFFKWLHPFVIHPSLLFFKPSNSLLSFPLAPFSALMTLSALAGETNMMELQKRHVCLLLPCHTSQWISLLSCYFLLTSFHSPLSLSPSPFPFPSPSSFIFLFTYPHPIFFTHVLITLLFYFSSSFSSFFLDTTSFPLASFFSPPSHFFLCLDTFLLLFYPSFLSFLLFLKLPHVPTSLFHLFSCPAQNTPLLIVPCFYSALSLHPTFSFSVLYFWSFPPLHLLSSVVSCFLLILSFFSHNFLSSLVPLSSPPAPPHPPSLPQSVRYCLKSGAAVWWLKRWQIDTFTHDRTLANDRTRGERSRDEWWESKRGRRRGEKITSWQQGSPYFHRLRWMDRRGMSVCSLILPLFSVYYFLSLSFCFLMSPSSSSLCLFHSVFIFWLYLSINFYSHFLFITLLALIVNLYPSHFLPCHAGCALGRCYFWTRYSWERRLLGYRKNNKI